MKLDLKGKQESSELTLQGKRAERVIPSFQSPHFADDKAKVSRASSGASSWSHSWTRLNPQAQASLMTSCTGYFVGKERSK